LIQGVVLLAAVFFVFINFMVDVLYVLIDPRVKLK
jgi:ABC-type dipeptide/oligopeptide/nickel transport system permease component